MIMQWIYKFTEQNAMKYCTAIGNFTMDGVTNLNWYITYNQFHVTITSMNALM
jgi:hypothetical protein